jgi:small subunit ribosomal protein S6
MALYECVLIARQDISATQVESLVEQFSGIIQENGGQVTKNEMWGLRSLAYRINKNRKGHYVLLNLDAPSAAIQEMERNMRINEDVLRYLTLRMDELEEGPSVILQSRQGRDSRGDRGGRGGPRGDRGGPRGDHRGDRSGPRDEGRRDAAPADKPAPAASDKPAPAASDKPAPEPSDKPATAAAGKAAPEPSETSDSTEPKVAEGTEQ